MNFRNQNFRAQWLLFALVPLSLTMGIYSFSQSGPPNIRAVELSADPLYAQGAGQKPTLTLALSVEFPTVGAQYRSNYDINTTYPGYFNSEKCYTYNNSHPIKHFDISGSAASHDCAGTAFSGNFLNWSASSSIDILRLGLTGGDRIEDTSGSTILQRAVLPKDFFNEESNFPQKTLSNAIARKSIPSSLFESTDSNNITISNCLDRTYIYTNGVGPQGSGTAACDNPDRLMKKLEQQSGIPRPSGYSACADENGTCSFPGEYRELVFGTNTNWSRFLVKDGVLCKTSTLGDPGSGVKKCYIKPTSLTPFKTLADIAGNSENFLYTRAKVCTASDSRTDLCQRYPSGSLKPVGNMQKYSDRVRLAAFGYLMDNTRQRYGGVLRAPMTYVGPKSYDANGNPESGTNPYTEWDINTGVFKENPRSATEGISGVINYLNRFGRTGSTPGTYKTYDVLGELYYESLRYLQGLPPTPEAISSVTTAQKDGYPVYSTWTDPFDGGSSTKNYACLRNSIITIADKNTHNDKSLPGNTRTTNYDFDRTGDVNEAANIPNFVDWTKVVGGFESGSAVSYKDGLDTDRSTSNPTSIIDSLLTPSYLATQETGAGLAAFYIAGAAYWAHTHDIRGENWTEVSKQRKGMRITTYVLDVNEGSASFNATTRHRSQLFLTAKYGGFDDPDGDGNPFTPANDSGEYNSRHWEKETDPGEAKTYFLASNATAVLKALDDIFAAATKVSNTITTPATSGNQLSTDDGYYYIASFDAERWSGDLKKISIKLDADGKFVQGNPVTAPSAAKQLDAMSNISSRKIFVGLEGDEATGGSASEFTWSAINSALKAHLNKATPTASSDGDGAKRLEFIRGDRSDEGTLFRLRNSRMGDIINSGAAYSGVPSTKYSSTSSYKAFYNSNKTRTKAVFVGANDGMLHGFNAETMDELFAYIPSWLGPNLSTLSSTAYNSSGHTSYVDAQPTVGEAEVSGAWKTVLVSGTGGGGQGVFALDVTNPTSFDASKVLWEFTDANDSDLGNVLGQPQIVKLRVSAPTASTPSYKWFAAVASGVNNYVNDGTDKFSTTGKPALFLLDLSKPKTTAWSLGTNYFKINFPVSNDLAIGTQELDIHGNGTGQGKATGVINFEYTNGDVDAVEFFYVGDLHGQFWKLDMAKADFSSAGVASWNLDKISAYKNSSDQPVPMYIAKDNNSKVQPISMTPTIAYGPEGSYIVAFGTGKYIEARDNNVDTTTQKQSFYVLFDSGNKSSADTEADTNGTARFNGRSRLQQGTVDSSAGTIAMNEFFWNTPRKSDISLKKAAGWYIDFPNRDGIEIGERQITNAALFGQNIMFTSLVPPSASNSACTGGESYFYEANLATGKGSLGTSGAGGAQGAPMVFSVGSSVSNSDSVGLRLRTDKAVFGRPGTAGDDKLIVSDTKTATSKVGRLSWRQINNYHELKNKDAASW